MKTLLKTTIFTTIILLISCELCSAQIVNSETNKNLKFTKAFSVARSTFKVNGFPSSPNYATVELRMGAGIAKPLGKHFHLQSGVFIGLKMKRQSYYFGPSNQFTREPWVLPPLDKAASSRDHYFLDLPLTLQFNPPKTKIGVRAGLNTRFWAPNNADVDILTARSEIGLLGGISHQLGKSINLGLDFYQGLSAIYGGLSIQSGEFSVRNQFLQLTLEHAF